MVLPPNCQIAKKDKRGPGGPLRSNALHSGKRDGKSTFDVLEGRSPSGETLVAKKTNKRTVRREYTKDDVKELRAHSKARTPVVKLAKNYEAHRAIIAPESHETGHQARSSTLGSNDLHTLKAQRAVGSRSFGAVGHSIRRRKASAHSRDRKVSAHSHHRKVPAYSPDRKVSA